MNLKKSFLLPLFLLLFIIPLVPHEANSSRVKDEIEKEENRLKEIRQEIEKSRKMGQELSKKEKGILQQLKDLEEVLDLSAKKTNRLRTDEKITKKNVEDLNQKIKETDENLTRSQEILLKRLRSIYLHGRLNPIELLFSSKTFAEGSIRLKYWSLIARQDKKIIEGIKRYKTELEEEKTEREKNLSNLRVIRHETENESTQQKKEKKEREKLLNKTKKEKKENAKVVKELEKAARELENLIENLEKKRKKKPETFPPGYHPFEAMKGKLTWPVEGKVISKFGIQEHKKYGTKTKNNGIDIVAPIGEPVHAIGHGKVVFADRFQGYGKIILIDHGGGYYTLYGHLSDYSVILDGSVEEGEQIGWTGDSGSLEGSKLHFEFRKNGQPVDPLEWLE
jgi:septal ring factor EnvC (AmiA/AmiB activator)